MSILYVECLTGYILTSLKGLPPFVPVYYRGEGEGKLTSLNEFSVLSSGFGGVYRGSSRSRG